MPDQPADPMTTGPQQPPDAGETAASGDGATDPYGVPASGQSTGEHADSAIADALGGFGPSGRHPAGDQADSSRTLLTAEDESFFARTSTSFANEVVIPSGDLPDKRELGAKRRRARLKRLGWGFWVAVAFCGLVILLAILANVLPLPNPTASTCLPANSGPSAGHLLGCDNSGYDVLSRVIYGSRVSLVVGFASIFLAELVGGVAGILAGFRRGVVDHGTGIIANVILAFPYLILALAITTYWGRSEFQVTVIIAIVATAPLYRVVRAVTIQFAERDYVLAAVALGSTKWRVLVKQILPDVVPTAITYGFVGVAIAITGEGSLSFLGQSVPVPAPTWGNMIAAGSQLVPSVGSSPVNIWEMLAPAAAMFMFITAINFIGDRLRSMLDVREGVL